MSCDDHASIQQYRIASCRQPFQKKLLLALDRRKPPAEGGKDKKSTQPGNAKEVVVRW